MWHLHGLERPTHITRRALENAEGGACGCWVSCRARWAGSLANPTGLPLACTQSQNLLYTAGPEAGAAQALPATGLP